MRSREASSLPPVVDQARGLRRWWLDMSLRAKGLIVIAIPLVALLGTTSASLVLQHSESHERSVGAAARNLTNAANLVLADMVNAETGIRGYGAVRDPVFLAPDNLMLTRIGAERKSLRDAAGVAGDSRQQRVVDATTGKVLFNFARLRSVISRGVSVRNLRADDGEAENDHGPAAPPDGRPHGRAGCPGSRST